MIYDIEYWAEYDRRERPSPEFLKFMGMLLEDVSIGINVPKELLKEKE